MDDNVNISGFYSGNVPEFAANLIGTGNVDASQVITSFNKANEAVKLVNEFDSSFLRNIAYIFNFDKGGAYGVYLPGLDKAIKTQELEKRLKQKGYVIGNENNMMVAYPQDENISQEQVQQDIDTIYAELEQQGGHVISVNTKKILQDAEQDSKNLYPLVQEVWSEKELWEKMSILHLGETIVHEATHAKGHMDEGAPTTEQNRFVSWLWQKLDQEYRSKLSAKGLEDQYQPLPAFTSTRTAKKTGWYKYAQNFFLPNSFFNKPTGSDLSGRHSQPHNQSGWGLLEHQDKSAPIETRLSRAYMSELPEGVDQANQSMELQLQLFNKNNKPFDSSESMEERLEEDRNKTNSYLIYEELLDERRVKPLMTPIKKDASSKIVKEATLFGWYNNLEISDGSTIPGLSDRVMAWDDRDESFAQEEDWIKAQPRYNPRGYDVNGFWYVFVEPRFKPELWEDAVSHSTTAPAKRFASMGSEFIDDLNFAVNAILIAKNKIKNNDIKSTRFIISEDIFKYLKMYFKNIPNIIFPFDFVLEGRSENAMACWIYNEEYVSEEDIYKMEEYIEGEDNGVDEEFVNKLFYFDQKDQYLFILDMIAYIRKMCHGMGVHIIGTGCRKLMNEEYIHSLEFSSESPENTIKCGHILARYFGVKQSFDVLSEELSFQHMGITFVFNGGDGDNVILNLMRHTGHNTKNNLLADICSKDFTPNMLAYDIENDEYVDYVDVYENVIDTIFPADYLFSRNPFLIIQAINLKSETGMPFSDQVDQAIRKSKSKLLNLSDNIKYRKFQCYCRNSNFENILKEYDLEILMEK